MEYGIQMYSVRDVAKENLKESLKVVADLGYKYVEFAGFFGNSAEDVKSWLDEYGLKCSGTHTGMDQIAPDKIDETIAYHKAIGCDNLIVPGAKWDTEENLNANIALLNDAQKKLAKAGIALGYHNHSGEFFPTPYGKIIEDELLARTNIEIEIDTFWAFNADLDVIKYLDAHKDRIRVIHVKDGNPSAPECKNFADWHHGVEGLSLGEGKAPVKQVVDWAVKNGIRMVVESEGLKPTGPEEVGRCIKFLKSLEK